MFIFAAVVVTQVRRAGLQDWFAELLLAEDPTERLR